MAGTLRSRSVALCRYRDGGLDSRNEETVTLPEGILVAISEGGRYAGEIQVVFLLEEKVRGVYLGPV